MAAPLRGLCSLHSRNTEPNLPDDLVFALRHRFYFDYFLAAALIATGVSIDRQDGRGLPLFRKQRASICTTVPLAVALQKHH
jgi:hypothetical protein